MPLRIFVRVAITTQQFCSNETAVNLFVSDGISKTAVWRKQDVLIAGTSQMRERTPSGTPVSIMGLRV
jgi:ethanolamine ammonia-lyase small subunit